MPTLHVCSLSRLDETATATGAGHLITLMDGHTPLLRPASIAADRHEYIGMNDITQAREGLILPSEDHVRRLLAFVESWDQTHKRDTPLLIHCWAGVSRSTAAAYITACTLMQTTDEDLLADRLRQLAPSATPNMRLITVADHLLKRNGRMVAAITRIGRGADCFEGSPFKFELT